MPVDSFRKFDSVPVIALDLLLLQIRDKALAMGARYEPSWSRACTHLISAFEHTPKASEARKTGGKIVTKEWIYQCDKQKKRLPEDG